MCIALEADRHSCEDLQLKWAREWISSRATERDMVVRIRGGKGASMVQMPALDPRAQPGGCNGGMDGFEAVKTPDSALMPNLS